MGMWERWMDWNQRRELPWGIKNKDKDTVMLIAKGGDREHGAKKT